VLPPSCVLPQADFTPSYDVKNVASNAAVRPFYKRILPVAEFKPTGGVNQGGANQGGDDVGHEMFDMEFDCASDNELKGYGTGAALGADPRTVQCEIYPGGLEDWAYDVGMRVTCPAVLLRRNRRLEIARSQPGTMFAAVAHKKDSSVAFIIDSGAFKTQVPNTMRHKLRDVKRIRAIPLDTVGNENPTCSEVGYMDFRVPGRDEVYTVECLLR